MSWVFGVVGVSLAALFAWGLFSPRSQWRVLNAWAVSDAYSHEPGGSGYGVRRLLSGLGLLGLGAVLVFGASPHIASSVRESAAVPSPVEVMWGAPAPHLIPRVVHGAAAATPGLVDSPVLAYQSLDETDDLPAYLLTLKAFSLLGRTEVPGMVGANPAEGLSAFGSAQILVNVRGSVLCIPREAVVIETETAVQVGIYYGLPDRADGAPLDHVAGCPAGDPLTASVLIPIVLGAPLGEREVQSLDGTPVPRVGVIE